MLIQPDDPRLTAHALGELEPDEASQLERALRDPRNERARQVVEEIKRTASLLETELAAEPAPGLTDEQRRRIEAGPQGDVLNAPGIFTIRRMWVGTGLAVAACVAITLALPAMLELGRGDGPVAIVGKGEVEDELKDGARPLESFRSLEQAAPEEMAVSTRDGSARSDLDAVGSAAGMAPTDAGALDDAATELAEREASADERRAGGAIRASEPITAPETVAKSAGERADEAQTPAAGRPAPSPPPSEQDPAAAPRRDEPPPPAPPSGSRAAPGATAPVSAPGGSLGATTSGQGSGQAGGQGGGGAPAGGLVGGDAPSRAGGSGAGGGMGRGGRDARARQRQVPDREGAPVEAERWLQDRRENEVARDEGRIVDAGGEDFAIIRENDFVTAAEKPLSTFSIDVDTASYSNVRRILKENRLPLPDMVRIEELINYFPYDYAPPAPDAPDPFAVHAEVTTAPWKPEHRLLKVGLKGREVDVDMRPATSLVFLVDTSGSMRRSNKLPLVKQGLQMLVKRLNGDDRVAIVAYAGAAGLVLPSTYVRERETILEAIDRLEAGGPTNGGRGIQLAYDVATQCFIDGGVNRVILCTDGDFNVGVSDDDGLVRLIEEMRGTGVFLSLFGYGAGNLKDAKMEKLSNAGNGTYGYVDSIAEARKIFVDGLAGTLVTIAKDVKIQVDFNPAKVGAYRLIGYENRVLADRDFADDAKDAGEIGAGHTVTALYEIVPAGAELQLPAAPESDFVKAGELVESDLMLNVRLRYKQPDGDVSFLRVHPVVDAGASYEEASADMRFAAAVAAFGMVLRDSAYRGEASLELVETLARDALAADEREQARRFLEDFMHYASIARPDLARANAEALLGLELDAETMQRLLAGVDRDGALDEALELAKQIDGLRDVGVRLEAKLDAAAGVAAAGAAARPAETGRDYRVEFVELVERAQSIQDD